MAKKIIRLPRTKEQKQENRERNERANRTILSRTLILMVLCGVIAFVPLIGTLYNLMITQHDYYNEKAIKNQTRSTNLTAARGVIYDANMNVLASSSTVETVFIDPNEIDEQMKSPRTATCSTRSRAVLAKFWMSSRASSTSRPPTSSTAIRSSAVRSPRSWPTRSAPSSAKTRSPVSISKQISKRYYPNSSLAAQALGFVSSDNNGSEGLEAYYNEELSGTAGKVVTSRATTAPRCPIHTKNTMTPLTAAASLPPSTRPCRRMWKKNLQNAIDKYDIKNGAFCIVMDVNTGEIKAMATLGSYDPNNYLEIYDDAAAALLEK